MSKPDVFKPALAQLAAREWGVFGPAPFSEYLRRNGLPLVDTAQTISVDSVDRLAGSLRERQTMVLRLGSPEGSAGTQFALISTPGRLADFFLLDEQIFTPEPPLTYVPEASLRSLYPYYIMPALTETSLVNLAFASGLLAHALRLEGPGALPAPATGSSTYSFRFRPHAEMAQVLEHVRGQVEVDALFAGRRDGQDCLFIVEAKTGRSGASLAKHKLVYPVLAVATSGRLPAHMQIVPVYLRMVEFEREIQYHVVECRYPDPRRGLTALDALTPVGHQCFSLALSRLV